MSIELAISAIPATAVVVPDVQQEPQLRRFSVDEYHRMIETGLLTENDHVQLIDGWIIEMPPIGPLHGTSTVLADDVIRRALPPGWHMRIQLPITLEHGEPEPDIAVAKGEPRDYSRKHPTSHDLALVVEVADRTLKLDRTQKAQEYASAQIMEYWIINLVDRQLEVHRDPQVTATGSEYRMREVIGASGSVDLLIDGQRVARLTVKDLLP